MFAPVRSRALLVALAGVAFSGGFFWSVSGRYIGPALIDDAFISLRYAKHLASGLGFVWNPGERPVQGFTSVSWVVQLAWLGRGFASLEAAASTLGRLWGLATVLASSVLFVRLAPEAKRWAFLPAAALAFSPIVHTNAQNGMETAWSAFLLMLTAIVLTSARVFERPWLPAVVLAPLAVFVYLARPDAALFVGVGTLLGVWRGRSERKALALLGFGGALALLLGLYFAWSYRTFGDLLPLPVHMKQGLGSIYRSPSLINFVYGHWLSFFSYAALPTLCTVLYLARAPRISDRYLVLVGATGVYLAYFLTVLPVMSLHWRYLVPAYGVLVVLGAVGVVEVIARAGERGAGRGRVAGWAAVAFFAVAHVGTFWRYRTEARDSSDAHRVFGELGRALADLAPRNPVAAGSEAGQFPYYSGWRFIDFAGLNDAFVAKQRRAPGFPDAYWRYLTGDRGLPDLYFEAAPEYGYAALEQRPELAARYQRVREAHPKVWALRSSPHFEAIVARLNAPPIR